MILLFPLISSGDDAFLGSIGGNVFPIIRNGKIRMSKEEIYVKMHRDSCVVTCKFWFTNESNDSISSLYMGFPDYFERIAQNSMPLRNFTCRVDGDKMEISKEKQVISPAVDSTLTLFDTSYASYDYWYCWTVNDIKPNQTIIVENTYTANWGGSLSGYLSFSYLIGTAQTWRSTIGNGKVVFDYSDIVSKLFIDSTCYENLRKGMNRIVYNDSTIYEFNDYYPEWNENLTLCIYPYWEYPIPDNSGRTATLSTYPLFDMEYGPLINFDKGRLRLMRNEIYARHGYVFKDEYLKKYFSEQGWYKPDPAFVEKRLNGYELLLASFLKKLEDRSQ